MLDHQATFDTMLAHLRAQGKPTLHGCFYRGPDNTKCGIGALIPDENYSIELEGKDAARTEVLAAIPGAEPCDAQFLLNAQVELHDTYYRIPRQFQPFPDWLEEQAQSFALSNDLTYSFGDSPK